MKINMVIEQLSLVDPNEEGFDEGATARMEASNGTGARVYFYLSLDAAQRFRLGDTITVAVSRNEARSEAKTLEI